MVLITVLSRLILVTNGSSALSVRTLHVSFPGVVRILLCGVATCSLGRYAMIIQDGFRSSYKLSSEHGQQKLILKAFT